MLIARLTPEQKPRGSANVSFIGTFSSEQNGVGGVERRSRRRKIKAIRPATVVRWRRKTVVGR